MSFSSPSVFLEAPQASLFQFPPAAAPQAIPPPPFDYPFTIPDWLYQGALDPKVPITIAAVYAVTIKSLNVYNKSTGKKPWAISKTRPFHWFVVLHNIFLAVYSAWTFWGMLGALRNSIVNPMGPAGLVGTVDSLCKFHGAPGLGNAVAFNPSTGVWETQPDQGYQLASDGTPSREMTGRLWNDGLAFYGWIFYLSKFYEVLDTFIILAKGKLSSTLQTYHHAGAMMCMWAGMRYMSVPIWMFAFVNSGIHAMMYTYYTLTAFNIRIPTVLKRTLTSMQITQFLVGVAYAMTHSFIYYTIPVRVPVPVTEAAAETVPAVAGLIDSIKQAVLGAADAVQQGSGSAGAPGAAVAYEIQYQKIPCVTSSGSTFAIWLNVLYLAPLTYLFVSFFIASYVKRSNAEELRVRAVKKTGSAELEHRRLSNAVMTAEKAGWDAAKDLEQEVYGEGSESAVVDDDAAPAPTAAPKGRALRAKPSSAKTNGHL